MSAVIGILIAALILSTCICLHELGHMAVAKKFGVGVVEYSVGMGKLLWWKRKGDTVYSIRALPLGGYCAMYGEQSLEADGKGEAEETAPDPKGPDFKTDWKPEQALSRATVGQRILICLAGPAMNMLLGLAACVALVLFTNFASVPVISELMPDHPAEASGVMEGDIVAGINGHKTLTWSDYNEYMACHPKEVENGWELMLFRNDEYVTVHAERDPSDDMFGIYVKQEQVDLTPETFLLYTFDAGSYMVRSVVDSLAMLVRGDAALSDMSGVIGITAGMGEIVDVAVEDVDQYAEENPDEDVNRTAMVVGSVFSSSLFMLALITVNLGIMNLIPIPALDGGRILFACIEKIIRRPIPARVEYTANAVSMIIVLVLMGYVCVNDIWKILLGAVSG